jgi:hypothetical protein
VRKTVFRATLTIMAVFAAALTAGAQGPPRPGGFGRRGPGGSGPGSFEFGGLVGGFGGKTITGKPFQATFTITRTETIPDNTITNTTTGTIARDADGDTYRDVTLPAIGPWASSGNPLEFVYIRNVKAMMQYIVNKTRGTYRAFAIDAHNPPPGGDGRGMQHEKGPNSPASNNVTVTDNPAAVYSDPGTGAKYTVDDKKITRTIPAGEIGNANPIVITTERWYSSELNLVLEETHSDPRFGSSIYQLSNIGAPTVSFTLDPSWQPAPRGKFGRRGPQGDGNQPPPPPQD